MFIVPRITELYLNTAEDDSACVGLFESSWNLVIPGKLEQQT